MHKLASFICVVAALPGLGACHRAASDQPAPVAAPLKVTSAPVVEQSVRRTIPVTGTLAADLRSELTANASGRILKTFVERGQRVEKGTMLAQVDVRSSAASLAQAQAEVASAKTQLDAARAECQRYDALVARGAITRQEHDKQTASCNDQLSALNVSQARASSAAIAVGDGTIRAPFAGVITERQVSAGDYVQPTSKVVTLVVSHPLRLKMTVPERRIVDVKDGALVTFSPVALPDKVFSGTVKYISGEVREATRDVIIEAIVANADGALLPGMFVSASLGAGERAMPVVPKSAVFAVGDEHGIYVVKDHRLEQRLVLLGPAIGDSIAIEEGAAKGDVVVTAPSPSLFNGAKVE